MHSSSGPASSIVMRFFSKQSLSMLVLATMIFGGLYVGGPSGPDKEVAAVDVDGPTLQRAAPATTWGGTEWNITDTSGDKDQNASIYGSIVVYETHPDVLSSQLTAYDISNGASWTLPIMRTHHRHPMVWEDYVVFTATNSTEGTDYGVYLHRLSDGITIRISPDGSGNHSRPRIDSGWVVWTSGTAKLVMEGA